MAQFTLLELFQAAHQVSASDILLSVGAPVLFRQDGSLTPHGDRKLLSVRDMEDYYKEVYELAAWPEAQVYPDSFALSVPDLGRVRVCIYRQRGTTVIVLHVMNHGTPTVESLGLPESIAALSDLDSGLVLIGGNAGSGRTSTLAALVDRVNHTRPVHILHITDKLEYLHKNSIGLVTQVEYIQDTKRLDAVLDSVLQQSVDVVAIDAGWNVDIRHVLRIAAAGKLVLLVTNGCDEKCVLQFFIDLLPSDWREAGLSLTQQVLKAIVVQARIPGDEGELRTAWGMFTGRMSFGSCEQLRQARTADLSQSCSQADDGWMLGEMLSAMAHDHVISKDQLRQVCSDPALYDDMLRQRYEQEKPNPFHAVLRERETRKGVQECEM